MTPNVRQRVADIIIWLDFFEKFRRVALGARLLGKLRKEHGVSHIVATSLSDLSPHLER